MLKCKLVRVLVIAAGVAQYSCAHVEPKAGKPNSGCAGPVAVGPVVQKIRDLEEAGAASNVTGMSVEAAERMFWPGYVSVGQDGSVTPRDAILSKWKAAPWASYFHIKELDIKVYCDMATAIGLSEALWTGAPEGTKPGHFRWLNVWTMSNDEWRLSATQFTRFQIATTR